MTNNSDAISLVYAVAKINDFIMFQDCEHRTNSIRRFFWSKENIDALAAAGTRMIALEVPASYQVYVDQVAAREIEPEEFAEKMDYAGGVIIGGPPEYRPELLKLTGESIRYAASIGIMTKLCDVSDRRYGTLQSLSERAAADPGFDLTIGQIEQIIHGGGAIMGYSLRTKFIDDDELLRLLKETRLPKDTPLKSVEFRRSFALKYHYENMDGDRKVAEHILQIAPAGKVAIFYGALHGCRVNGKPDNDLDDYLIAGGKRVGRIAMVPDLRWYAEIMSNFREVPLTLIATGADPTGAAVPLPVVFHLSGRYSSDALGGSVDIGEVIADLQASGKQSLNFKQLDLSRDNLPAALRYDPQNRGMRIG